MSLSPYRSTQIWGAFLIGIVFAISFAAMYAEHQMDPNSKPGVVNSK